MMGAYCPLTSSDAFVWIGEKCRKTLFAHVHDKTTNVKDKPSFDHVVEVMKRTGKDLPSLYKETSAGGLAMQYRSNNVIPTGLEFQED